MAKLEHKITFEAINDEGVDLEWTAQEAGYEEYPFVRIMSKNDRVVCEIPLSEWEIIGKMVRHIRESNELLLAEQSEAKP